MYRRWLAISLVALAVGCTTESNAPQKNHPADMGQTTTQDMGTSTVSDTGGNPDQGTSAGTDAGMDMANPVDMAQPECTDGQTMSVSCGLNGRGTADETCAGGMWGPPGTCTDPDECVDGATQSAMCGRNNRGMVPQTCMSGKWVDSDTCTDPDECTDNQTRTTSCGLNNRGTQDQTCTAGTWTNNGQCNDSDTCTDGQTRNLSCGLNDRGTQVQNCVNGTFQDMGSCQDPDACIDGTNQNVACGLNGRGTKSQSCTAGQWMDSGSCSDPDVCTDNDTQTAPCGLNGNGTKPQTCVTGMWQDSGACTDPDVCTNGDTQSIACGFDGMQAQDCTGGQWVDNGTCVESVVGYCQTQPATLTGFTNEATSTVEGTVYVDQKTPGTGAGYGVVGEIVWGPIADDPSTWTNVATATYFGDADGLTPGDLANDVWHGTITPTSPGSYGYVYRFSADNGTTWQMCDTNGTTGPNFDSAAVGQLDVTDPQYPDDCKVQFPQILPGAQLGTAVDFYGRVTKAGTTGMGSAAPGVVGELLVGPVDADPRTDLSMFQTNSATYNSSATGLAANEDEYQASFTPSTAGDYAFGYRFSLDNGTHWSYCGLHDAYPPGTYAPVKMGWMHATGTPDVVDFCHTWQTTLTDTSGGATLPVVTVEVYQGGVTDMGAMGDAIEAQAAAFEPENDPAIASVTWNPLPYKGRRQGVPNNYEYEGNPYVLNDRPASGSYNVVVRVRLSGSTDWTYCDTDDTTQAFRLSAATLLDVAP